MRHHHLGPVLALVGGLVLPTASVGAQDVRGLVYDSVAAAPLPGARVQFLHASDLAAPLAAVATSDSAGRFRIAGLAPGRYLVGFLHPALDALGIEPPLREVDVGDSGVDVVLAVPGPARLLAALCDPGAHRQGSGAVAGIVRDAMTRQPVGAAATARWPELVIGATGFRQRIRQHSVAADEVSGRFLICGLPTDVEIALHASREGDSTGAIPITFGAGPLVRRDVWIGVAGTARLSGRVVASTGEPVADARVTLSGSAAEARTDGDGRYAIPAAPGGSRTVMVSAIGFMPEQRIADIVAGRPTTLDVRLTTLRIVLDTMRVVAQRLYGTDRSGFERRRRQGVGHFFSAADIDRIRPARLSDILHRIPAARLEEVPGGTLLRMRGSEACAPVVFLDGLRVAGLDVSYLDRLVQPTDVESVEVYDKELAPAEYTTLDDCASIVIWTRRSTPGPGRATVRDP